MTTKRPRENHLAQNLYEHRHEPDQWEEEPAELNVRPSKTAVISCRMPRQELYALEQAANAAREPLSEYVRKAIIMRRGGTSTPRGASVNYSIGTPLMQVDTQSAWSNTSVMTVGEEAPQTITVLDY